jgi:hypothetical protein
MIKNHPKQLFVSGGRMLLYTLPSVQKRNQILKVEVPKQLQEQGKIADLGLQPVFLNSSPGPGISTRSYPNYPKDITGLYRIVMFCQKHCSFGLYHISEQTNILHLTFHPLSVFAIMWPSEESSLCTWSHSWQSLRTEWILDR